jgi:hypothetical protein
MQKGFNKMHLLMAINALAAYPDHNKWFDMYTDASQEGIVDIQKFIFDAQYVLYLQNSIFYLTTIYCFAIQFY